MKTRIGGTIIWFVILLIIWEVVACSGLVSELVLPRIETVFSSFGNELAAGSLFKSTSVSLGFVFAGIVSGCIAAFLLSSAAYRFTSIRRLTEMLTAVLHPLPGIAMLPLFMLIFGIGAKTLLMVIIHSVLWPLVINITAGFKSVPSVYKKIGENYGLRHHTFFFRIMLPAAFPFIFSGLKTAWARAWRAAVSAEMVFGITGSGGGLGWFVYSKRTFMDTPGMYAGILMLALLGLLVESGLFHVIEQKTLKQWGTG